MSLFLSLLLYLSLPQDGKDSRTRAAGCEYAVVVSKDLAIQWKPVVDELVKKHNAAVVVYDGKVSGARDQLAEVFPKYACFLSDLPTREFVIDVHRMTRSLDDDPYTDCLWGILTGFKMDDALRVAKQKKPLKVRRGVGGCGLDLDAFVEGAWYSEGKKNEMYEKKKGGKPEKKKCPDDTTECLVKELNENKPDLFVTSGHATHRDWQIGYSYRNGQFLSKDGQLFGLDTSGKRIDIDSPNPKIYSPLGNCLMGNCPDRDTMVLAWFHTGGACQMVGYTISTWFGYGGWGTHEYFLRLRGQHTYAESFYVNNQSLVYRLETKYPKTARKNIDQYNIEEDNDLPNKLMSELGVTERDELGLLWDRDTVAFYGDPAWEARMERVGEPPYNQKLTERGGTFTFEVKVNQDTTWSRPPVALLPYRVEDAEIKEGKGAVTDNFVLMDEVGEYKKGQVLKVVFKAKRRR